MGIFVDYSSNVFANIANGPTAILSADANVLVLNSIIICNRGPDSIRFNLQKARDAEGGVTIFYINEFEIKPYNTVDVIAEFGLQIFLQYSLTPSVSDSLICFSNGYTQKFDCEVNYTILNELPFA